ncbi:class I SAM-dependent methyltransferase [Actinacidiphila glaucinigra]|uniref:Methyltransferase domain-containing protein n=1 Tax=Actinacidiphila glaucinigra TaxID=235986 RepID=A0A239ME84_9ACTN|nr:methyltransferase domain-containing protein [Actinacidiphila glaucinigra]SNT40961.1 Methyltransferase domain-containing protein [Actinacidiphila glaucinigra]
MTTQPAHRVLARSFDTVAAQYAAARPGYPGELFDAVEEIGGRPFAGATVLDVGAGTGIATALMRARGAHVTAVEPGSGMAAQLRAGQPDVPLVRADGDALPFASGVADFVTYAQAWHWTDPAKSSPEAARVLRPGGALALWWNVPDTGVAWVRDQEERLARAVPRYHENGLTGTAQDILRSLGSRLGMRTETRVLRWSRTVPLDTHLTMLGSRSYFAVLAPGAARRILSDERRALLALFPDGQVAEPYKVDLTVAVKRPDGR